MQSDDEYFLARLAAALRFEDLISLEAGTNRLQKTPKLCALEDLTDKVAGGFQYLSGNIQRNLAQLS